MKQNLKQTFFQVFTAVFLWLSFITKAFYPNDKMVPITFLWNIAGATLIFALLFGVMYNALWYHLTLKPVWNIAISSIANTLGGLAFLYLIFQDLFHFVWKWTPAIFLLTVILHIIAFYFYAKYENNKQVKQLNAALQN